MTFTIGRASLPVDPSSARWNGDDLTITGWIKPTTANDTNHAYALRQQLLGMVDNPDEGVFPCTFSVDPNWDGFYQVKSVSVDGNPGLMETQGIMPYTINLTRVGGGFATPQFETIVQTVLRTNSHGVTTPTGILTAWYGDGTVGYPIETDYATTVTWPAEDGLSSFSQATAPQSATSILSSRSAADFYKTMCKIEVKYGSTYYPVVGNQLPKGTSTNWRISNGLVRLYPTAVSGNGRFTVEQYTAGATWAGREFGVLRDATNFVAATYKGTIIPGVTVLRNSPEIVVIRLKMVDNTAQKIVTYDFVLRRGDLWCELAITTNPTLATSTQWGIGTSVAVASTAFTGGARATANDANGLRYLISSPSTISTDLVNGRVYLTAAATSAIFQITPDYVWSAGSDAGMRDLFLSLRSERQQVVSR